MLKLDVTKAADLLGWHPLWEIDRAVDATAEWYRAFVRRHRRPGAAHARPDRRLRRRGGRAAASRGRSTRYREQSRA